MNKTIEEIIYRHCEGEVTNDSYDSHHWKCSGEGNEGKCSCVCHRIKKEAYQSALEDVKGWLDKTHNYPCDCIRRNIQCNHKWSDEFLAFRSQVLSLIDKKLSEVGK